MKGILCLSAVFIILAGAFGCNFDILETRDCTCNCECKSQCCNDFDRIMEGTRNVVTRGILSDGICLCNCECGYEPITIPPTPPTPATPPTPPTPTTSPINPPTTPINPTLSPITTSNRPTCSPVETKCHHCSKYGELVPVKGDCTKFCVCQYLDCQNMNVIKECLDGLFFDYKKQRCEWPLDSDCPYKSCDNCKPLN